MIKSIIQFQQKVSNGKCSEIVHQSDCVKRQGRSSWYILTAIKLSSGPSY